FEPMRRRISTDERERRSACFGMISVRLVRSPNAFGQRSYRWPRLLYQTFRCVCYCSVILAVLISSTFALVSASKNARISAVVWGGRAALIARSLVLMSSVFEISSILALSFSAISCGMPGGPCTEYQIGTSEFG